MSVPDDSRPREEVEPDQRGASTTTGLRPGDFEKLYSVGELQEHAAGAMVVTEGESQSSVFILLEGEAEVAILRGTQWFAVATLGPGSVFGELSFFDRLPRSARVTVLKDCSVLMISESSFERLRAQDADAALAFTFEMGKVLGRRLRDMNLLVQTLTE